MKKWLRRLLKLTLGLLVVVGGLMLWNLRAPGVPEPSGFAPGPPPASFTPVRLRVLTWNVWGLLWITPRREERLRVVAREAARLRPDIAAFQEAFVAGDREVLITALRGAGLEHARWFPSGLVGSGLLLVSRFPITSDGFIRYTRNGRPEMLHHGDWWAGKGLSLSTLSLPGGVRLYVGNTHLHARYRSEMYHTTQLAQAGQLIPWARRVRGTGSPALWMGDWNNTPGSTVLAPLTEAGAWHLLTTRTPRIDHIFGSGDGWEWRVIGQGQVNGHLEGEPKVPWSDHAARWVDVELSLRPGGAP